MPIYKNIKKQKIKYGVREPPAMQQMLGILKRPKHYHSNLEDQIKSKIY